METGATTGAGRRWVMPEGMTGRPACIRPGGGWHAASSHGNGRKPRGPVRCTKAARACCPEGADVNPDWLVRLFCSGLSGCPAPVSGMRVSGRRAPQGQPLTAPAGPDGGFYCAMLAGNEGLARPLRFLVASLCRRLAGGRSGKPVGGRHREARRCPRVRPSGACPLTCARRVSTVSRPTTRPPARCCRPDAGSLPGRC